METNTFKFKKVKVGWVGGVRGIKRKNEYSWEARERPIVKAEKARVERSERSNQEILI